MASSSQTTSKVDLQLADEIAKYYDDPLGFILFAWDWGKPNTFLEHFQGPDKWHIEFLTKLGEEVRERKFDGRHAVAPIRFAVSSGHSSAKSTLAAWLTVWIMATRPHAQGTVTANTFQQISTKTWAAIQKWAKASIIGHWFEIGSDRLYRKGSKESWFVSGQSSDESNSESFAGQHAATSTSFYIIDEASAVADAIWTVAEGGLLSGHPMIFAFGNPTRNHGKFYRICFGNEKNRWNTMIIDSRDCQIANKAEMAKWVEDYGEDSDFVRVRVRGLPPRGSDLQYIDSERVKMAQERNPFWDETDPLVVGIDIARGGADSNAIVFRRGNDAKSIKSIIIPGEETRDSMKMVSLIAEVMSGVHSNGEKPQCAFLDQTGVGGPIGDRLRQLGYRNVIDIAFSWKSPDKKYANMRAYIWGRMRDWLLTGCIPSDPQLELELTGPGYTHNVSDAVLLESKEQMKKRGVASPDVADALALTFSQHVAPKILKPMFGDRPINPGYQFGSGSPRRGTPWI